MILLDGKKLSTEIKEELALEVKQIASAGRKVPHLAVIIVGEDGASQTYVNSKVKSCHTIGFESTKVQLPVTVSEADLLKEIHKLNNDASIDGFIVQVPLPEHIDEMKVTEAIDYKKDVDGFHPMNFGRMALNLPSFLPATPAGIVEILDRYNIETSGKSCVVMGRSSIVGSPMSILMTRNTKAGNCTVTVVHSRTKNLEEITRNADILIVAIGKPHFVKKDMVKEGAVVIDVGIHRVPSDKTKSGFRLVGDVDFDEVSPKCHAISPVPGGVGPMTIAALLLNTMKAVKGEVY